MSSSSVEDEISLARFNQNLLALASEQERNERRVRELEQSLHEAHEARSKMAKDVSALEGRLREETGRGEEITEAKLRAEKAAEDERSRHALTRRAHEEQSAAVLTRIASQGQQIHALEETLRAKEGECAKLKLAQTSAEGLIGTFRSKLTEMSRVAEDAAESESACAEALGRVRDEQSRILSLLATCQERQQRAIPGAKLEAQLRAARAEADEARTRTAEGEQALLETRAELVLAREAEATARASFDEVSQRAGEQHTGLERAERQLAAHGELLNKAFKGSMKVGERNEQLVGQLLRSDAVAKLLVRELMHAEAEAHGARQHATAEVATHGARVRLAEAREAMLAEQLSHALRQLDAATDEAGRLGGALAAMQEELAAAKQAQVTTQGYATGGAASSAAASEAAAAMAAPSRADASATRVGAAATTTAVAPNDAGAPPAKKANQAPAALAAPAQTNAPPAPMQEPTPVAPADGSSAPPQRPVEPPPAEPMPRRPSHVHHEAPRFVSSYGAWNTTAPPPNSSACLQTAPYSGSGADAWHGGGGGGGGSGGGGRLGGGGDGGGGELYGTYGMDATWSSGGGWIDGGDPADVSVALAPPPMPMEPPAAASIAPPFGPPSTTDSAETSCAKCKEPLFGATSRCGKCGRSFHAHCSNRSAQQVGRAFTCAACAPKARQADASAAPPKRQKKAGTNQQQASHQRRLGALSIV